MILLRNSDCLSDTSKQQLCAPRFPPQTGARPRAPPPFNPLSLSQLSALATTTPPLETLFQSHCAKNRPRCNELTVLGAGRRQQKPQPGQTKQSTRHLRVHTNSVISEKAPRLRVTVRLRCSPSPVAGLRETGRQTRTEGARHCSLFCHFDE